MIVCLLAYFPALIYVRGNLLLGFGTPTSYFKRVGRAWMEEKLAFPRPAAILNNHFFFCSFEVFPTQTLQTVHRSFPQDRNW